MLAFQLSLQLIFLIAIGFAVWRLGMVDEKFDTSLTSFLINIALPCMIMNSFNSPYSSKEMRNCVILLIISVLYLVFCFGAGQLVYIFTGKSFTGRMLRFGAMFTNFSFVGMPVAQALYGQTGLLYFVIFIVPIRMVYYSAAKPLLSPPGTPREKRSVLEHIKSWLSPPVTAVLIGLPLYFTGLKLPVPVDKTISAIGAVTAPMGMILCGISLGKNKVKSLLRPKYLFMPVLRNMIMPAATTAVMYILPVDPLIAKIVILYSSLPVAAMLAAFTIKYEPSQEARLESAGGVFYSVAACSLTIPLWALLADYLF
ncbi:MAG: AEC family transporter [Oscillospiraceae bacterium]|nr:AEC family transporter [Oscillospiraceae bacterium]